MRRGQLLLRSAERDVGRTGRRRRRGILWCHRMLGCSQGNVVTRRYPIPHQSRLLVWELDNSVDLISIKVTLKTIIRYDTPRADRSRGWRGSRLTRRWYQTCRGIHYHISPSEDVTCHFTLLRPLIILQHIKTNLRPRWHEKTPERGGTSSAPLQMSF